VVIVSFTALRSCPTRAGRDPSQVSAGKYSSRAARARRVSGPRNTPMLRREGWPMSDSGAPREPWTFRAAFAREVKTALAVARRDEAPVTEADVAHLPAAVRRYLRFTGVVGAPRVWNYRVRFSGAFRNGTRGPWMNVHVAQRSFVTPMARLFLIDASMFGLPVAAYHRYVGADATFRVRVAALFTVVNARGPEMTKGETVTLFNDLCLLAPATLAFAPIEWRERDAHTVDARFTNSGHTVGATLTFDDSGALTDFVSDDRFMSDDGRTYRRERWSTPVHAWGHFGAFTLPLDGEARWLLSTGPFPYARFRTEAVEYNSAAP
jgi:hypothetical protein